MKKAKAKVDEDVRYMQPRQLDYESRTPGHRQQQQQVVIAAVDISLILICEQEPLIRPEPACIDG